MSLIGLSRSTRQVLGLPDYVPVPRVEVASQAWFLAGLGQAGQAGSLELDLHDDAAVDFVVGIVEAVEDFVVRAFDAARWPAAWWPRPPAASLPTEPCPPTCTPSTTRPRPA